MKQLGQIGRTLSIGCFLGAILLTAPTAAQNRPVTLDDGASIFAVVTHKAGPAAKFAHNHLVAAADYDAQLSLDPANPEQASFLLSGQASSLVIDDPARQQKWYPRLAELGILDQPFVDIAQKDRDKIRQSMLSKKQLNAQKSPELEVQVTSISRRAEGEFPFDISLRLQLAGVSAERNAVAKLEVDGDRVMIEAHAELKFTDFGIKPYSAMLGAVRNQDMFHLFLHLEGTLAEEP